MFWTKTSFPWAWELVRSRARRASSEEQANEWTVWANKWADKQMAQYSKRLFLNRLTHCAVCSSANAKYYPEKILRLFESRVTMDENNFSSKIWSYIFAMLVISFPFILLFIMNEF